MSNGTPPLSVQHGARAEGAVAVRRPVQLTFFTELDAPALAHLFRDPALCKWLRAQGARISLGLLDFSAERAAVVRCLNQARIPVIAWQLLPREQGYWYHLSNAPEAALRYGEFLVWTRREGLEWAGIGVDIEPDIGEFELMLTHRVRFLWTLLRRGFSKRRLCAGRDAYAALAAQMRADGYPVHSYEIPFMEDERRAGATVLQRILGITDLPAERRVLMLYTSFFRPIGPAVLWHYARGAQSVGVGITGGGVEMKGVTTPKPLSWNELAQDLLLARRWCQDIHIFSLEGCVDQGFLDRIEGLDWDSPIRPPLGWTQLLAPLRPLLRSALWLSARPLVLSAAVLGVLAAFAI